MYAQCPHCYSIYRIRAAQIRAAGGRVRCTACEIVFNALHTLRETLPEPEHPRWESIELPFDEADGYAAALSDGDHEPRPAASSAFAMPGRPPRAASPRVRMLWAGSSLVLAIGLIAQFVVLAPRALAHHPDLRPVATTLCRLSGCTLPERRDLDRLRLASRDVRAHPSVPGALIISATMLNEAGFTQPFPVLEIALSDLQGAPVALRRFRPGEYLPDRVDIDAGMSPDSVVRVSLEVVDPGEEAVAFEFAFRSADR